MAKIISTIKAILTRIIFSAHSIIAIWQVTESTGDIIYWALCSPLVLLLLEGIFTVMIKKTQEWRWFCPSVFLYLSSVVPAIWLLELDKVDRRLTKAAANSNDTSPLDKLFAKTGIEPGFEMPKLKGDNWITVIEQFLMLILIVGRWLLPKGDLTRDQLSQLLLVYIGTAADIIEFFDSYKDDKIAEFPFLVYLTLGIWSWSLMQFTIVLSATRARRSRGGGAHSNESNHGCCDDCCCGIDVWGIVLNVLLQDAPFLAFRFLLIFQYKIISYMNVFFTCKNTLVIFLQMYRLYVVNAEFWKGRRELKAGIKSRHYKSRRRVYDEDANSIYMISTDVRGTDMKRKIKRAKDYAEDEFVQKKRNKKDKAKKRKRKDTGYSTASSQNLYTTKSTKEKDTQRKDKQPKKSKSKSNDCEVVERRKEKRKAEKGDKKKSKHIEAVIEESSSSSNSSQSSNSTLPSYEVINEKKSKTKHRKRDPSSSSSSTSTDDSDTSSSTEST